MRGEVRRPNHDPMGAWPSTECRNHDTVTLQVTNRVLPEAVSRSLCSLIGARPSPLGTFGHFSVSSLFLFFFRFFSPPELFFRFCFLRRGLLIVTRQAIWYETEV